MNSTMTQEQTAYQGGPTVSTLQDVASPWHVEPAYLDAYLQAARLLDYTDLADAAEVMKSQGGARSYRDQARAAVGMQFTDTSPAQGWPKSIAGDYSTVAWVVHCRLVELVVPSHRTREYEAAMQAQVAAQVCLACGEAPRVADMGAAVGLCAPCAAVADYVRAQRAAELAAQKVGGKFTGKSRGQLVSAYMAAQGL